MRPSRLLTAVFALLSVATAKADIVAEDSFARYAEGSAPTGFNYGTGWLRSWVVGSDTSAIVRGGTPSPRLAIGGPSTVRALMRRLAQPVGTDGRAVFFRSDFSFEANAADFRRLFGGWYFADAKGYRADLAAAVIGLGGQAAARFGEETITIESPLAPAERHTVIARLDGWDAARKVFTEISVWLDPDKTLPVTDQPRPVSVRSPDGIGPIEVLYFRVHNLGEARIHLHEVRFASDWEDLLKD